MRKIYLHGALGKKYGKIIELDVATAAEAIRALSVNFPTFNHDIQKGSWHVVRGHPDKGLSLDEKSVATFKLGRGDLHIMPYIAGSKRGGVLKIILGVALAGIGLIGGFLAGGLATPIIAGGGMSLSYGSLAMMGVALAAGGIAQMLSPEQKDKGDKDSSFMFNGPGNAYEQGNPVPLVYGEVITGSVMISGGVDIEKIAVGA